MNIKEVNIYTFGICKINVLKRPGSYITILEYKGHTKQVDGFIEETTTNRTIITGMIQAVKLLKEPCKIHFYNAIQVGLKKIYRDGKYKKIPMKDNGDLLNELSDLLEQGGHLIEEHITKEYEKQLRKCNRKYDNKFAEYETIGKEK